MAGSTIEAETHALIVDDNVTNGLLLQRVIGKIENCAAHSFTDPVAALAKAAEMPFDIVLVDYMMPQMSGIEFTKALRRMPGRERTPVILVTSDVERSVKEAALATGAVDLITKPIDPAAVRNRIREILQTSVASR
jgi:putative two-component system response regulator